MQEKRPFAIPREHIKTVAPGLGGCFATDRVMRDGLPVGYMYREQPTFEEDSGWRFFAGDEDQAYLDEADNTGIYDVNTVANYARDIVPLLKSPVGSAFFRDVNGRLRVDKGRD